MAAIEIFISIPLPKIILPSLIYFTYFSPLPMIPRKKYFSFILRPVLNVAQDCTFIIEEKDIY